MDTSMEKLKILLGTGKITNQQYDEMLKNLPEPGFSQPEIPTSALENNFISIMYMAPWSIKICSTILILMGISLLFLPPYGIGTVGAVLLCGGLGIGLLKRMKGLYLVTLLISIGSILFFFEFDVPIGMGIGFIYSLLLASAWRFYFQKDK